MVSSKRRDNQLSAYRVKPEDVDDSESLHVEVDETLGETAAVAEVVIPGPHLPVVGNDTVHGSLEVHGALVSELLGSSLKHLQYGLRLDSGYPLRTHSRLHISIRLSCPESRCHFGVDGS